MFPRNSVHLCTVGYCRKQRIQTLYGKETCQHSNHLSPPLSKKHATAGKTPGCKQWHLCTTGPLRIQSLYGKETCQPSTSMSHSPLFKEVNHLHKKNPNDTYCKQWTPVHSWHSYKQKNQTMCGKRQLSNLPTQPSKCKCANQNKLYLSPFNIN